MNYELTGAKWGAPALGTSAGPVTYSFVTQIHGDEPIPLTAEPFAPEYKAEVREAFAEWSATAGVAFVEVADSPASQIRIGWEPTDGGFYGVGDAYWTYEDGRLQRTWIGFDDGETWVAGGNGPELRNGLDFEALALHEIGHAIGLGHYEAAPAIMNSVITADALQPSDVAGARALYGTAPASVAVAAAGSGTGVAGANSRSGIALLHGIDSEAGLERLLAAAARPGFDDAVEEALGLGDGVLDGLGDTLAAAADSDLELADAAALRIGFPQLETALASRWPAADDWFA